MESKQSAGSPYGNPPPYSSSQPPIGFESSPPAGYAYPGQTTVVTTQPTVAAPQIIVVAGSNCPACHAGILQPEFTCCGICLGICFFPIGLLCCFVMRERRCSNCRAVYA